MATSILWLDENKTLLYFSVIGQFSRSEARDGFIKLQKHVESVEHEVDIIIDRHSSTHVPKGMLALAYSHLSRIKCHHVYLVGFPALPRMIAETLSSLPGIFDREPIFVSTVDEVLEKLAIISPNQVEMTCN